MRRQVNREEYLVELEGDDDAEAEREPEGRVEQEEGLPPAFAPVRGQPRAPPPRASAAAPRLRPRRRPPRSCERRRKPGQVRGRTPAGSARGRAGSRRTCHWPAGSVARWTPAEEGSDGIRVAAGLRGQAGSGRAGFTALVRGTEDGDGYKISGYLGTST